MFFFIISLLLAIEIGLLLGFVVFSFITLSLALNVWCSIPIANISTVEIFLVFYAVLFFIFKKFWEDSTLKTAVILNVIYWTFTGITGFVLALIVYEAFVYGIDSPKFVMTMVDGIPVLDSIENVIAHIWCKIFSFFNNIVLKIDNFVNAPL